MQLHQGLHGKWVKPAIEQPESYIEVLGYEDVNHYIGTLAKEYASYVPNTAAETINKAASLAGQQFKKREDPFSVPAENLSSYLRSNALVFIKFSEKLRNIEPFLALLKNHTSSLNS